jgi:hypothetical protein
MPVVRAKASAMAKNIFFMIVPLHVIFEEHRG